MLANFSAIKIRQKIFFESLNVFIFSSSRKSCSIDKRQARFSNCHFYSSVPLLSFCARIINSAWSNFRQRNRLDVTIITFKQTCSTENEKVFSRSTFSMIKVVTRAKFFWHSAVIDNQTFFISVFPPKIVCKATKNGGEHSFFGNKASHQLQLL